MARLLGCWILFGLQRYLGAIGKTPHGIHETDVLVFFDEREDVAALVAAKTVKDLLVRIDVEAGGLLLMKRTKRSKVRSGTFQRQIAANDIHDVAGGTNLFECVIRKQPSHPPIKDGTERQGKVNSRRLVEAVV